MAYESGSTPARSSIPSEERRFASFTGGGAGVMTVSATGVLNSKINEAAGSTNVRNGAGDFTITFLAKRSPSFLVDVIATVRGPTKLFANVAAQSLDSSGRLVVQVLTWDIDAAAAADPTTSDFLTLHIVGGSSKSLTA